MQKLLLCSLLMLLFATGQISGQTGYYITAPDHTKLYINEYGTGKPVILLAGGPGLDASYMDSIWLKMPDIHFVVPDERGSGKSVLRVIDTTTISLYQFVEDLEALRIHLKLSKMVLAGHSWGGMLAMLYAAKYPARVEHMILLGSGGATAGYFKFFEDNFRMRLTSKEIADMALPDSNGLVGFKAYWPGYFYSRERALITRQLLTPASLGQDIIGTCNIVYAQYPETSKASAARLKLYSGRVTLVQGRQDPTGESTAFETKGFLKQTSIYFIERSGHFPWLESKESSDAFFKRLRLVLN